MSKIKIVCLVLAAVLASVGTVLVIKNLGGEDIGHFERPVEDINAYEQVPQDVAVVENDAIRNLFVAHYKLLQHGFKGVSEGYTNAMGIKQQVLNVRYVVGDFDNKDVFKEMVTKGVVSSAYQLYLHGGDYIYRDSNRVKGIDDVTWSNSAQPLSESEFYDDFGHRSDRLTGYILNYDTVLSGELVQQTNATLAYDGESGSESGVLYTYRYELDPVASTVYLRREMVTNGGLAEEPTFTKAVIYVTMDDEWNIHSLRTESEYKAKTMGIFANCSEDITETFTYYDGELPNLEFFEPYFGQEGGDIQKEQTALDVLMKIFEPYLGGGESLQVALQAILPDQTSVNGLVSIDNLDISDLSRLAVSAQLGGLDVSYDNGAQTVYVKYQDFQGSTTVDGITQFAQTLTSLLGQGGESASQLGDINADELLAGLTYSMSADGKVCTVNLPLELGDVQINACLYADVDGETYTFTHADVSVGDIKLQLAPQSWQVPVRSGAYPEILGIADIICDGKLSLNADIRLPLGDGYNVHADILADLAARAMSLRADLGNGNGTLNAVLCNNVIYADFGEVKVKLDLDDAQALTQLLQNFTGNSQAAMPSVSASSVIAALGNITATQVRDGAVTLQLPLGGFAVSVDLVQDGNSWHISGLQLDSDSVTAAVVPSQDAAQQTVTVPADAADYTDITPMAVTFAEPIANMLKGNGFGADFSLQLDLFGEIFDVSGNAVVDNDGTVIVSADIAYGALKVIRTQIIYDDNVVFLYCDGINVAFRTDGFTSGDGSLDVSALLQSAQMQAVLAAHPQLKQFVEQAVVLANGIANISPDNLQNVDFSALITEFDFVDHELHVTLNLEALGLQGIAVDLALYNNNGKLAVRVSDFRFGGATFNGDVTLYTDVPRYSPPQVQDYVLNLRGNIAGAETRITCDFANMDIWATVQLKGGKAYIRYTDGSVYVQYGAIKAKLDTTDLGKIINGVTALLGGDAQSDLAADLDVNALLDGLKVDLYGDTPNITLAYGPVVFTLNLTEIGAQLYFDSVSLQLTLGERTVTAELTDCNSSAEQLSLDGEFVDANALIDSVLQTVTAFTDNSGIAAQLTAQVNVNGKAYNADIALQYNGGVYVSVILRSVTDGIALASGNAYYVGNTLYLDVNGIKQAIDLSAAQTSDGTAGSSLDEAAIQRLIDTLTQIDGIGETVAQLAETIKQLPQRLNDVSLAQIVKSLRFDPSDKLNMQLDLTELGLSDVDLMLGLGGTISLAIDGLAWNGIELSANADVYSTCPEIAAPDVADYNNQLDVTVRVGDVVLDGIVQLDLYNREVAGQLQLTPDDIVAFKYADGTIYLQYGNISAKLATADIAQLAELFGKEITLPNMSDSSQNGGDILATVVQYLNKISVGYTPTADGYALAIHIDGTDLALGVNFACTQDSAILSAITVNVPGETPVDVTAALTGGKTFAQVDTNCAFVDVKELAKAFAEQIIGLTEATGYSIAADKITVTLGEGKVFTLSNLTLSIVGGNVRASFNLSYNGVPMLTEVELYVVNKTLYLTASDLKLAVPLDSKQSDGEQSAQPDKQGFNAAELKQTLNGLLGYNDTLDGVLNALTEVLDKLPAEWNLQSVLDALNLQKLLKSLTFDNNSLTLQLNGSDWGLPDNVTLTASSNDNALTFALSNVSFGGVSLAIDGGSVFAATEQKITAPEGDNTTNLKIKIDENNIIDAKIDLCSDDGGSIRLKLGELNVLYLIDDKTIKVNYNKLYVQGNIDELTACIDQIKVLVDQFSGTGTDAGVQAMVAMATEMSNAIDLKSIVKSLSITAEQDNTVHASVQLLGLTATAVFDGTLKCVNIPITISKLTRNCVVTVESKSADRYVEFPADNAKYVDINTVFDDFMPTIKDLVNTNSWRFEFACNDKYRTTFVINGDDNNPAQTYAIGDDSYVVFYYNQSQADAFKIRAHIKLCKLVDDSYQEFALLDLAIVDGRVYVTFDTRTGTNDKAALHATVSVDALSKCIELKDKLVAVIPQIGDLLDGLSAAKNIVDPDKSVSLSGILQDISYATAQDGAHVFGLTLNGESLLSDLGEIILSVQTNIGEGGVRVLQLNQLKLSYGKITVDLQGVTVSPSTCTEDEDGSKHFAYVDNILMKYFEDNATGAEVQGESFADGVLNLGNVYEHNLTNHIDLDSVYELLSALTVTAGNYDDNDRRSFKIDGTLELTMSIPYTDIFTHKEKHLELKNISLPVTLYVDIDEVDKEKGKKGDSYFALKLHRNREKVLGDDLFADHGGDSYLLFNTAQNKVKLVRDSIVEVQRTKTETITETYDYCTNCKKEAGWLCSRVGHKIEQRERTVDKTTKYTEDVLESDEYNTPTYNPDPISGDDFMANLVDGQGYLFELINFGKPLGFIDIRQIITDNIAKGESDQSSPKFGRDYGIEDILDSGSAYTYTANGDGSGVFGINANLQPVSNALRMLNVNITHTNEYKLTAINGSLNIVNLIDITLDLNHTTPGYGTAYEFNQYFFGTDGNVDDTRLANLWKQLDWWENGYKPTQP